DFYVKPLANKDLYPRLYKDDVYNSISFKLFNTIGWNVTYNGQQTQWLYIDDPESLERGDLIFFAAPAANQKKEPSIHETLRVKFRERYSGYITACGIYLGEDRMLTVADGTVCVIEGLFASESEYAGTFDSARRIRPTVEDERAFLIETLISTIYDRLGTPYSNGQRLGDRAYDCSGIVCWALGSIGCRVDEQQPLYMDMDNGERTAAGLSNTESIYWEYNGKTLPMNLLSGELNVKEDVDNLQRGDLVFTRSTARGVIGHIMVYLGNNTVIHSTTVSTYRGTMISEIRPALKALYSCTRRFGEF
ncbi:MAG: C40 family peptidase, partial [Clostridia bacterium]|nr:C40 family peptidase [Clostridia bacterium]